MKPKIHYIVRHATLITDEKGNFDVKVFTNKVFHHENPIVARNEAFSYYKKYQAGVDEYRMLYKSKELKKEQHKNTASESEVEVPAFFANSEDGIKLWKQLYSVYEENPDREWIILNPNKSENLTPHGDAVVIMAKNESLIDDRDSSSGLIIHRTIKPLDDTYEIDELMFNLDVESALYQQLGYDTNDQLTKVYHWDSERYYEGLPQEKWADWHTILKTPFDWTPYSKENWWNDPEFFENHQLKLLNEAIDNHRNQHELLISGGESETVEFKPLLYSTIPGKDKYGDPKPRNMGLEVSQVICSFMNKHGGNIYIGVKDDGTIQGVDLENKNNEDHYVRAFSTMKRHYFGYDQSLVYHYIKGKFITVNGKRLFCITVKESKDKPTFLYNRNSNGGNRHEFYAREGNSSYLLYDSKHLIAYIEEKWWNKKPNQP